MLNKRLNIMIYSNTTGEEIILPVNPENIELKHEKSFTTYDVINYGKVNTAGETLPVSVKISCLLPDDNSAFALGSRILYQGQNYLENSYSIKDAIQIFSKWAKTKDKIRLVIDEDLNIEGVFKYFKSDIRENTPSRKCEFEILEYKNPYSKQIGDFGLYVRNQDRKLSKRILMKKGDTIYSIASLLGLNYKELAEINGIEDVNKDLKGTYILLSGGKNEIFS